MNPLIAQQFRRVLWPWCLMLVAGVAPVTRLFARNQATDGPETFAVFGFFGGAAILTALSFRRAASDRPAEPGPAYAAERRNAWSRTMLVVLAAVAAAGLIACLVQTIAGVLVWSELSANAIEPVLLLVIIVCSTSFWTLLARSIVGGLLLTGGGLWLLYLLLIVFVRAVDRIVPAGSGISRLSHDPEVHSALMWFVGGFGLCYAAVMLWLGRRRFAAMPHHGDVAPAILVRPAHEE